MKKENSGEYTLNDVREKLDFLTKRYNMAIEDGFVGQARYLLDELNMIEQYKLRIFFNRILRDRDEAKTEDRKKYYRNLAIILTGMMS